MATFWFTHFPTRPECKWLRSWLTCLFGLTDSIGSAINFAISYQFTPVQPLRVIVWGCPFKRLLLDPLSYKFYFNKKVMAWKVGAVMRIWPASNFNHFRFDTCITGLPTLHTPTRICYKTKTSLLYELVSWIWRDVAQRSLSNANIEQVPGFGLRICRYQHSWIWETAEIFVILK